MSRVTQSKVAHIHLNDAGKPCMSIGVLMADVFSMAGLDALESHYPGVSPRAGEGRRKVKITITIEDATAACNANDQLTAEIAALHEQLTRKDAALLTHDTVRAQLITQLKAARTAMAEIRLHGAGVRAIDLDIAGINAALKAAGAL